MATDHVIYTGRLQIPRGTTNSDEGKSKLTTIGPQPRKQTSLPATIYIHSKQTILAQPNKHNGELNLRFHQNTWTLHQGRRRNPSYECTHHVTRLREHHVQVEEIPRKHHIWLKGTPNSSTTNLSQNPQTKRLLQEKAVEKVDRKKTLNHRSKHSPMTGSYIYDEESCNY